MRKKCLVILMAAGLFSSACQRVDVFMKDGYYTAEIAEFDENGWKEYVTICVSGGKIITVEYNAFNKSGFIKSWDIDYMRSMSALNGTYPNEYTRTYAGGLLRGQGTEHVDHITGASVSYRSFLRLAAAAVENARMGRTTVSHIPLVKTAGDGGDAPAVR